MVFKFKPRPRVHLYTMGWNEDFLLNYFFRHYDPWVDRYVFYDDGSTDRTLDILARHPKVETRPMPPRGEVDSFVLTAQQIHETCWKESRGAADWVVITAVDEFLYAPDIAAYLTRCTCQGVTAIPALGYQMLSDDRPTADRPLIELVRRGTPYVKMNKLSVFNPDKISETLQEVGRHAAAPAGAVVFPPDDVLLNLHYKFLSFEETFRRNIALGKRLGSLDRKRKWGYQYNWARWQLWWDWQRFEQKAIPDVFAPGYDPDEQHSPLAERWWRKGSPPVPDVPTL